MCGARHPFRQATFIVTVATLAAMGHHCPLAHRCSTLRQTVEASQLGFVSWSCDVIVVIQRPRVHLILVHVFGEPPCAPRSFHVTNACCGASAIPQQSMKMFTPTSLPLVDEPRVNGWHRRTGRRKASWPARRRRRLRCEGCSTTRCIELAEPPSLPAGLAPRCWLIASCKKCQCRSAAERVTKSVGSPSVAIMSRNSPRRSFFHAAVPLKFCDHPSRRLDIVLSPPLNNTFKSSNVETPSPE